MIRKKCRINLVCQATAYIQFNDNGEPVDFDELDEITNIEDYEVKEVIY